MSDAIRRWRMALGKGAEQALCPLSGDDARRDEALEYLYGREYDARGIDRGQGLTPAPGAGPGDGRSLLGGQGGTRMTPIRWLGRAERLFPVSVFETLQTHALDRYALTELLNDPATLEKLEPSRELLKLLLSFHDRANPAVKDKLREIANRVIRDLMERLRPEVERAFSGRRNRFRRSNLASAANFDWRATLRDNLATYDPETKRIVAERLRFNSREKRKLPWTVILCVDQSGSMMDSIIHSAVMAAILTGLPGVTVKMVLFDTSILDVSDKLTDPLETLLSVQLGGGTQIGRAVEYCEGLVSDPSRTVFALVTDFAEGGSPHRMLAALSRMAEARVRLVGLPALDDGGTPFFDTRIAAAAEKRGMHVAAMTPDRLAVWLAEIMA